MRQVGQLPRISKESVIQQINIVKISTNYEKPRQSLARIKLIKIYCKNRTASNSSCIFLEKDPCLRRATKIVATEVGQVKQTVTLFSPVTNEPSYVEDFNKTCKFHVKCCIFLIPCSVEVCFL